MTLAAATLPFANDYSPLNVPIQLSESPYEVIHSTQGRIRLTIPRLMDGIEHGTKLKYALKSLPFITEVRINQAAKSLVINYDSNSSSAGQIEAEIFKAIQRADLIIVPEDEILQAVKAELGEDWEETIEKLKNHLYEALKGFLYTLGEVCLVFGFIGLLLPLIPGWPFFLLSSLCFWIVLEMQN